MENDFERNERENAGRQKRGIKLLKKYRKRYDIGMEPDELAIVASDFISDILHGVSTLPEIGPLDDVRRVFDRAWMHFEAEYGGPDHPDF